jgi:8-oxo-dGTP diphosphatase
MQKVSAAVIVRAGKYFIAKRRHGGSLSDKWEFPGGKVEPGENPREALVRELYEEFEISVKVGKFIGSHRFRNEDKAYKLMAYYTEYLAGELKLHEHQDVQWIELEEFDNYDFAASDKVIVEILKKNRYLTGSSHG